MANYRFDPIRHPRDREGQFRRALGRLKLGDTLVLPGGIRMTKQRGFDGLPPTDKIRMSAYLATNSVGEPVPKTEYPAYGQEATDKIVRVALDRSAQSAYKGTLGGNLRLPSYSHFRRQELTARREDSAWTGVVPEDDEDLLTRPTHGDPNRNRQRLEDRVSELRSRMEDGPRQGEVESDIEDEMRPVVAAIAEIDALPEEEYETRTQAARATAELERAAAERGKPLVQYLQGRGWDAVKDVNLPEATEEQVRALITRTLWANEQGQSGMPGQTYGTLPLPESPGGSLARDYSLARSDFRRAEADYLGALTFGEGDVGALKARLDRARGALDGVNARSSGVMRDLARSARITT